MGRKKGRGHEIKKLKSDGREGGNLGNVEKKTGAGGKNTAQESRLPRGKNGGGRVLKSTGQKWGKSHGLQKQE